MSWAYTRADGANRLGGNELTTQSKREWRFTREISPTDKGLWLYSQIQIIMERGQKDTERHGSPFVAFAPENLQPALMSMYNVGSHGSYHMGPVKKGAELDGKSVTRPNLYAAKSREFEESQTKEGIGENVAMAEDWLGKVVIGHLHCIVPPSTTSALRNFHDQPRNDSPKKQIGLKDGPCDGRGEGSCAAAVQ